MSKFNLILSITVVIGCSVVLLDALSTSSTCYLEKRVRSALNATTNPAINQSLALFMQASLAASQNGTIQQAWSQNYVLQALLDELAANQTTNSVLNQISNLFNSQQQSNSNVSYCSIMTSAQNAISNARLSNDQQAEFSTVLDYGYEIARGQSCNIWGSLYSDPRYSATLINATSGLSCQDQSALAQVTGCYVNLCASSTSTGSH